MSFLHIVYIILHMKTSLSASFPIRICLVYQRNVFLLINYRRKAVCTKCNQSAEGLGIIRGNKVGESE